MPPLFFTLPFAAALLFRFQFSFRFADYCRILFSLMIIFRRLRFADAAVIFTPWIAPFNISDAFRHY
jgi:hypothetical protein